MYYIRDAKNNEPELWQKVIFMIFVWGSILGLFFIVVCGG